MKARRIEAQIIARDQKWRGRRQCEMRLREMRPRSSERALAIPQLARPGSTKHRIIGGNNRDRGLDVVFLRVYVMAVSAQVACCVKKMKLPLKCVFRKAALVVHYWRWRGAPSCHFGDF